MHTQLVTPQEEEEINVQTKPHPHAVVPCHHAIQCIHLRFGRFCIKLGSSILHLFQHFYLLGCSRSVWEVSKKWKKLLRRAETDTASPLGWLIMIKRHIKIKAASELPPPRPSQSSTSISRYTRVDSLLGAMFVRSWWAFFSQQRSSPRRRRSHVCNCWTVVATLIDSHLIILCPN